MADTDGTLGGNAKRGSDRLGKPDEKAQESRLSGRQSKLVQKLPSTDHRACDFEDEIGAIEPQKAAEPVIGEDVAALIEADPQKAAPVPLPLPQQPPLRMPPPQAKIEDDTRYLIKKDADAVRDSRRNLKPAKPNGRSSLTECQPEQLSPVTGKRAPTVVTPVTQSPSEAEDGEDESGGKRSSSKGKPVYVTLSPPVLTLTHQVEDALAGKDRFEMDVLALRRGKTTVRISVDLIQEHQCGIIVQHSTGKGLECLTLIYRTPRSSRRPGETGVENAFDPSQAGEHDAHRDHLRSYAIPDANANWTHVRNWVHRASDGSLLGRPGVSLVKTIEHIATLITHRTTLARYLSAVCELSRAELDARRATRLVLAQGLAWNEKHGAPEGLLRAQALLRDEYDELIAKWNATYICSQQLAWQYGLSLDRAHHANGPVRSAPATAG